MQLSKIKLHLWEMQIWEICTNCKKVNCENRMLILWNKVDKKESPNYATGKLELWGKKSSNNELEDDYEEHNH